MVEESDVATRLTAVNAKIASIEHDIIEQRQNHERVRNHMLLGIITRAGINANDSLQQLEDQLKELQIRRQNLVSEMDGILLERARLDRKQQQPLQDIAPSDSGMCIGGCNPDNIVSNVDGVDVCLMCHKTYLIDCSSKGLSFDNYHPGDTLVRVGGYKPPNHHAEMVAQFQGKRRAKAPESIVKQIGGICDKFHIPRHKISPALVRSILKQLQQDQTVRYKFSRKAAPAQVKKITDYYKYAAEISGILSGIPPPWMTSMQEDLLAALFLQVIHGYKSSPRYKARKKRKLQLISEKPDLFKKRKIRTEPNNMNFNYTFYKMCEMVGYVEFLQYIPLPKSVENLDDNDENGWKHICKLNGWSYTPTR